MSRTGATPDFDSTGEKERYERLLRYDIPVAAIKRYIDSHGFKISNINSGTRRKVAEKLSDEEIEQLILEYKYAGQQSVNYFVITGIERKSFSTIEEECELSIAESKAEVGVREPYLATSEILEGRLYLCFGYIESEADTDPKTGIEQNTEIRGRAIAVIRDDTDLVAIRCSDENIAKKVANQIAGALRIEESSASYRPDFGLEFEKKFREELVDKYYSLKIRINDEEGRTVETVRYSSKTDEEGERMDAREDEDVIRQLEEKEGEIRMGYVELKDGSKFYINRDKSKISFLKYEQEQQISEITEVIDNVLGETGEYPQSKLEGLGNVPE
ncbi:hypothetical protein [Haloarcula salinisoli]|uniref:Uncharacterized protein n=1 Tax=Haloarcula salinisoli TaxID=2487746 RepID=A0A8J7YKA9_9EURY|nr:hypothetical protein [Halomicroarcula salinisoli]MBX0305238.1 hypothetical protein [Halomicroarcula salinisoli]